MSNPRRLNELPADAKDYIGLTDYGIDATGNTVFFGFIVADAPRVVLAGNFSMLGVTINYLHRIATEAQAIRAGLDQNAPDKEARASPSNRVLQAELHPDLAGTEASLLCRKTDGTQIEAQLSRDMLQKLLTTIPKTLAEMDRRRAAHRGRH